MWEWIKNLLIPSAKRPQPSCPQQPKVSPLPARTQGPARKLKQKKTVIIGVDFGTSSTKVIVGGAVPGKRHLLTLGDKVEGYPDFALPSAVQICDGRAYFGAQAEQPRPNSIVFRSFKVCLACQHRLAACRSCDHRVDEHNPGHFFFRIGENDVFITAHQLATWYLAYVFQLARAELDHRWGESVEFHILFNVGAPIDQHNAKVGEDAFARAAYWAEKLSHSVWDGRSVNALLDSYKSVSSLHPTLPSKEESRTFVQPETAAGLMSFVTSPTATTGLYGIMDIGAGTTDVSFFRLADLQRDQPRVMAFYEAKTEVVGADEIDDAIAELLACRLADGPNSSLLSREALRVFSRRAKENIGDSPEVEVSLKGSVITLSRREIEGAAGHVTQRMASTYVETNRRSFNKEPQVNRWASYTLFFLGGGSRLKIVEERLRRIRPSEYNRNIRFGRMKVGPDLDAPASARSDFDLLAVAYGLSHSPVDFPRILEPSEVEPLKINLPRERPDRDELYPP